MSIPERFPEVLPNPPAVAPHADPHASRRQATASGAPADAQESPPKVGLAGASRTSTRAAASRSLPLVDLASAVSGGDSLPAARAIAAACRGDGFFQVVNHGAYVGLQQRLDRLARRFFALPEERKAAIAMRRAGRAWRGWFPLGGELTAGVPDLKEGLYFGEEHHPFDPRVQRGEPLHGANLFPADVPELREAVLAWMAAMTRLGHDLARLLSIGLGLPADWLDRHYTARPTVLFRIFRYPADEQPEATRWGVGEHTDYGLLTILAQDDAGGLEVRTRDGWIDVPPVDGALVVNVGDMLERLTGGGYRSAPHRVRNRSGRERIAMPFFFDPDLRARLVPLHEPTPSAREHAASRWDGSSVHDLSGTYGDYLLGKVSRVFPDLATTLPRKSP